MPGENRMELKFGQECADAGVFQRSPLHRSRWFRVEKIAGANVKTFTTSMEIDADIGALILTEQGAVLARSETATRWYLMPANGVGIIRGPRRILLRVARGSHIAYITTWEAEAMAAMMAVVEERMQANANLANGAQLPYRSIVPHFENGVRRFRRALDPANAHVAAAMMTSVVGEAAAFLGDGAVSSVLAPTPRNVPEALQALIESVRSEPDRPWPLKEAADEAGYSPFHFSRIFKQQTGFGFHEFVDRTRTESAVEMLFATEDSVDAVATQAGFGTTQGLRESIKEYLGLVPTELRSDPDESLIS